MLFNTQQFLCAACAMFSFTAIGCTDGFPFSFPLQAHGQEITHTPAPRDDVVPAEKQKDPDRDLERTYQVIAKSADGSVTVQFPQLVCALEARKRTVEDGHGGVVEETWPTWDVDADLITAAVPAGVDIVDFLNEGYPQLLPRPEVEEEVLYEIVEREPDGTTVVLVNLYDFETEFRTRIITRNGRKHEQCYARFKPKMHIAVWVRVPPGQDILETVNDFHMARNQPPQPEVEDIPATAAPAPVPAPAYEDIPPAPAVARGA